MPDVHGLKSVCRANLDILEKLSGAKLPHLRKLKSSNSLSDSGRNRQDNKVENALFLTKIVKEDLEVFRFYVP
jgi:hypothetical protein